jgi:hypothetical protein
MHGSLLAQPLEERGRLLPSSTKVVGMNFLRGSLSALDSYLPFFVSDELGISLGVLSSGHVARCNGWRGAATWRSSRSLLFFYDNLIY